MMPEKSRMLYRILLASAWILLVFLIPVVSAGNVSNVTDNLNARGTPSGYFITIDPVGNHTVGEVFFVNGTTNIPPSEKLFVTVRLETFQPGRQPFLKATVPILEGKNGVNSWSCNITPSMLWTIFRPYTFAYMADVSSSMKYNVSNYSQSFDIYVDESNISLVRSLMQTPAASQTISPSQNVTSIHTGPSTPTPAASLPLIIVFTAIVGIAMQQVLHRKKEG